MANTKANSFTLSELVVVMIITAIVVGIAFAVLRMVQKQSAMIQANLDKTAALSSFEQILVQDFSQHPRAVLSPDKANLVFTSEIDTVQYKFGSGLVLRESDSIKVEIEVVHAYFGADSVQSGDVDALDIRADKEIPGYRIFAFRYNDSAIMIDKYGI